MTNYDWTGASRNLQQLAAARIAEQGAVLTGIANLDVESYRDMALAELMLGLNTTTLTEIVTLLNNLRNSQLYRALGNPGLQRVSNFDVNNANAISYVNGGTLKTFSATTTFDTGTVATIATTKFGAALLTINAAGSAILTWASLAQQTYASEALAIAALAMPDATSTPIGYITVQAAGGTWTAGTDALASGSGGTPATATTYYNLINPNNLMFGAAVS